MGPLPPIPIPPIGPEPSIPRPGRRDRALAE